MSRAAARTRGGPRWLRLTGLLVLVALTFLAAHSCQQSQVRISQERAVATAREAVDFTPRRTQIRLVRQGINSHPFWAVSLSTTASATGEGARVTVVRVDANTGEIASVERAAP